MSVLSSLLQVMSREIAKEWVSNLRRLINYWSQRHIVDTKAELDLLRETGPENSLVSKVHHRGDLGIPLRPDEGTFAIGAFWNWCVIDGCRAILKGGRIHSKEKLRSQYTYVFHARNRGKIYHAP